MLGLLKLQEFAAQRGEGLIPELLELLGRRPLPEDASSEPDAAETNIIPLRPARASHPQGEGRKTEQAA
jgi:hypothetical protein